MWFKYVIEYIYDLAEWVKEMVFQMLWDDFITGDPLYHHLRYMERNPVIKLDVYFADTI